MDNGGVERLECLDGFEKLEMCMYEQLDELVLLFLGCDLGLEELSQGGGGGFFIFCFDEFVGRVG